MMLIERLAIAQLCKRHSAYNLHEEDLGGDGSGGKAPIAGNETAPEARLENL